MSRKIGILFATTLVLLCIVGCTKSDPKQASTDSLHSGGKKLVTEPAPSVFEQVVGNNGTIVVQVFDKWVIVYEYPTEPHQLLGIAAKATVHKNNGTRKKMELGEKLATASLSSPKTFERSKADYPLAPKEIVVDEEHLKQGKSVYKGSLTFKPQGEISKRTYDSSASGETSADYFISWPMFNYIIEGRQQRGTSQIWTIELNPKD